MGARTGISWTTSTWNPVTGCDEVSAGCDHCYARTVTARFPDAYPNGFTVTLRPDRLDIPLRWTTPRMVFVNSMSDVFHKDIPDEYVAKMFAVMATAPQHVFQVLTKRHGRMRSLLSSSAFRQKVWDEMRARNRDLIARVPGPHPMPASLTWPLPNVWVGVSAEDQRWWDLRIPALLDTPAAVRFVSAEPLLGAVAPTSVGIAGERLIDWLIIGGESGPGARLCESRWIDDLVTGTAPEVAVFVKQLGTRLAHDVGLPGKGDDPNLWANAIPTADQWRQEWPTR